MQIYGKFKRVKFYNKKTLLIESFFIIFKIVQYNYITLVFITIVNFDFFKGSIEITIIDIIC